MLPGLLKMFWSKVYLVIKSDLEFDWTKDMGIDDRLSDTTKEEEETLSNESLGVVLDIWGNSSCNYFIIILKRKCINKSPSLI